MSLSINNQMTQEEQEKALANFQQNVTDFHNDLRAMVIKYSSIVPIDVMYLQLSFWANIQMKNLIEASQLPGPGSTEH